MHLTIPSKSKPGIHVYFGNDYQLAFRNHKSPFRLRSPFPGKRLAWSSWREVKMPWCDNAVWFWKKLSSQNVKVYS